MQFSLEEYWKEYLTVPSFHQYIWSSERLSFQSVYNAYEEFFVECARVANQLPKLRAAGKFEDNAGKKLEAKGWFREAFGDSMLNECWTSKEVNGIRIMRHSLAHAGGKITDDIKAAKIKVRAYGGVIHMFPSDVRGAIATLSSCVLKIIDAANPRPEFG